MAKKEDYYEILGVERGCDTEALKKSYRALALKYHPDRNPGDSEAEEMFKKASEAYGVLSDPEKRRIYDSYGHDGLQGAGFHSASFEDIFSGFGFSGMGDIFRDFFGGGGTTRPGGARRGGDLSVEVELEFVEAYTGLEKEIRLPREESCQACSGTGSRSRNLKTCPQCGGTGQIYQGNGFIRMAVTCLNCGGKGRYAPDPCPECRGTGRIRKEAVVLAKIPAGVDSGQRMRLKGKGDSGFNGGPAGDLFLEILVKSKKPFTRDGGHVIVDAKIDMVLAALGGDLEIPTVTGETRVVEIPPETQNNKHLRLEGLGFPNPNNPSGRRGDLIVTLTVATPRNLTERQEELLKEFARIEEEKGNESPFKSLTRKMGKVGEKFKKVFKQ
ncbi:MAG: molecular chaperone DnaJ [Deltaproteobacteria bacterium]|jgi:molecular chaperone DnaJ|nr:molecular chaperone DnaJ [Deltaproteobacteria bacterium]